MNKLALRKALWRHPLHYVRDGVQRVTEASSGCLHRGIAKQRYGDITWMVYVYTYTYVLA